MDNDLLTAFLSTLKETNATLLDLVKITAHNQLAIKLLGGFMVLMGAGFITWVYAHLDRLILLSNSVQGVAK